MLFVLKIGELTLPFEIADDKIGRKIAESCPIWTSGKRWKQELILELPQELEIEVRERERGTLFTTAGDVLYWAEGKALCFFYGLSQPYCPALKIGTLLAIPERLGQLQAEECTIDKYDPSGEKNVQDVIKVLKNLGYKYAVATLEDGDGIVCYKQLDEYRLYLEMYVEEHYVHIYTRPLFKYDYSPQVMPYIAFARELVRKTRYARVDVDHYEFVCLSAVPSRDARELSDAISELEKLYVRIMDRLQMLT